MSLALRLTINIITGIVVGFVGVFIVVIVAIAFAFVTNGTGGIPGLIDIWTTTENGATAINFNPNFAGMGIAALGVALVYIAVSTLVVRRRPRPTLQS